MTGKVKSQSIGSQVQKVWQKDSLECQVTEQDRPS